MPHLSELARQYRGTIDFVGINVWETRRGAAPGKALSDKVDRFVKHSGPVMDYAVAAEGDDHLIEANWLKPAGVRGIPSTFVINKEGVIVWIGFPSIALDEVLRRVAAGTFKPEMSAEIERQVADRNAKFVPVQEQYMKAFRAENTAEQLKILQQIEKEFPERKASWAPEKYSVLAKHKPKEAKLYGVELRREFANHPSILNITASVILSGTPPTPDYALGLQLMQRVYELSDPQDFSVLRNLARAYFLVGKGSEAVEKQTQALRFAEQQDAPTAVREEMKKEIANYRGHKIEERLFWGLKY